MSKNYDWAGPNADLATVLDKYCYGDSKPPFALMLNGPWGCGKTWFVKHFFEEKKNNRGSDSELNMIYVSLYGIETAEDITKAIYTAMHPILGGMVGELGKTVFKGLLKSTLKIDLHHLDNDKADLSAVLGIPENTRKKDKIFKNRILVFDDVERAKMAVSNILSLVQPLVESHENRVILIANENEIAVNDKAEKSRYRRIKEKTVYLTLSLTPNIESSWSATLEQVPKGPFQEFLKQRNRDFISFIKDTKQDNLRLLQFFVHFGEELFPSFNMTEQTTEENKRVVFETLCLLYVLLIEKNIYGSTAEEIQKGSEREPPKNKDDTDKTNTPEMFFKKYLPISRTYNTLWKVIYNFISTGFLNEKDFRKNLSYVLHTSTTPIWKRLSFFHCEKPTEEHYDSLIRDFRSYLQEKTAKSDDELLHVCDVYLMLKTMNIDGINDKYSRCILKQYIKRYCESILSKDINSLNRKNFYDEPYFYNPGFQRKNIKKIKKINNILAYRINKYIPERIAEYCETVKTSQQLSKVLEFCSETHPVTANNAFLHKINPDNLLASIKQLPTNEERDRVFLKLYPRFQKAKGKIDSSATHDEDKFLWEKEKEWFEKIIKKLEEEANDSSTHPLMKKLINLHLETLRKGPQNYLAIGRY